MNEHQPRRASRLITFTIVFLLVYAPLETWYSLPALWDPFYLVDFLGMVLLTWGVVRCRRSASASGFALLAAGYAWEGANFWRALFGRLQAIGRGESLALGSAELCFVACGTIAVLFALIWSLRIAISST